MRNLTARSISRNKIFIVLNLLLTNHVFSQKVYEYNSPGTNCYSQYLFDEKAPFPKGVLVIDAKGEDLKTYCKNNPYLNSQLFNEYNFLYINILNKENQAYLNCYNVVIYTISSVHNINESTFFLISSSEQINQDTSSFIKNNSYSFNIINSNQTNLEVLKTEMDSVLLNKAYKNPVVYSYEEIQNQKMLNYKRNFDVSFFCSPLIFFGPKLNTTSDVIGIYGLSFKKSIGAQTALLLNLNMGSKKPPDKSVISEQVQTNQKGNIDSFVLLGGELLFRYYNNPDKPLRLFSSFGFGMYSMLNILIKVKSSGASVKMKENSYYTPVFETGLEYRLSPVIKVNGSIPMRYFVNKSDNSANTFTMGINLGISATLNPNSFGKSAKKKN